MIYGSLAIGPQMVGMFLIGFYVARRGILSDVQNHARFLRRVFLWCLLLGVVGNGIYATLIQDLPRIEPSIMLLVAMTGGRKKLISILSAYGVGVQFLIPCC